MQCIVTLTVHTNTTSRCIQNLENCKGFSVVDNRELYNKDTNLKKPEKRINNFFQALSGASNLQQSSCTINMNEHLGINRNTKL